MSSALLAKPRHPSGEAGEQPIARGQGQCYSASQSHHRPLDYRFSSWLNQPAELKGPQAERGAVHGKWDPTLGQGSLSQRSGYHPPMRDKR
jgi:hypothetical protein